MVGGSVSGLQLGHLVAGGHDRGVLALQHGTEAVAEVLPEGLLVLGDGVVLAGHGRRYATPIAPLSTPSYA